MARDYLQEAKENYADAKDAVREQYERIRQDFRFSNPAEPKQWDDYALKARSGRPMHTLDRTNQFIQHVVNSNRERKTSADILPADSKADVEVAKRIKGIIRHIEYTSRADIAWDTAADHQVRGGLGWVRITPKVVDPEMNEQEILIQRVIDPLSCLLDPNSTEPDGSDAMFGFAETTLTNKAFERQFKKAKKDSWDSEGWFGEDSTRIAEYFRVVETKTNRLTVSMPDGNTMTLGEDEYWALAQKIGFQPQLIDQFIATKRLVKWCKLTGAETIEETDFPSIWIPLIPVQGHELWVEGKRYLCGMVRRLMDGQKLHNYEMSALTESLMAQPKAPFLVSDRAIEGHEDEWAKLNSGNPAFTTYSDMDPEGRPITPPIRLSPPNFPVAYANTANLAVLEMESAVGMPKPTMGIASNAISGRAKLADKEAGATATFHFQDNLRVAKEHAYRVILDMLPRIYNGRRQAKILGEDDKQSSVMIDSEQASAKTMQEGKVASINLGVGRYDVRVKIGPSFTTIREELGVKLQELGKGNPVLAAALMPMLMKLNDLPEADKIARVAIAMLPPEVQKAYHEEDTGEIPAAAKATIDQQGQQITQMAQAMDQAGQVIKDLQSQVNDKADTVKSEAAKAMAEIKAAQADLKAQSEALAAKEREVNDAVRIAQLEIQLAQAQQNADDTEGKDESAKAQTSQPMQITVPSNDEAIKVLADVVRQAQETMAAALAQNAQIHTQTQSLVVDAIEDMAEALSATRNITLKKGPDGRTIGATSVSIMPESETVQ
jgi:hypothetical protein